MSNFFAFQLSHLWRSIVIRNLLALVKGKKVPSGLWQKSNVAAKKLEEKAGVWLEVNALHVPHLIPQIFLLLIFWRQTIQMVRVLSAHCLVFYNIFCRSVFTALCFMKQEFHSSAQETSLLIVIIVFLLHSFMQLYQIPDCSNIIPVFQLGQTT